MRRHTPEPPPGRPVVEHKPGLANDMLRELAPLLAAEGIDVDDIDAADLQTLQAAMNRAVERRNMELFSPSGEAREHAVTTLRLVIGAITDDDPHLAAAILDAVPPESDGDSATVAGCIGLALGLLDDWLPGHPDTPPGLAQQVRLPAGHWLGERAATDILTLAGKRRAFRSLGTLITRQGGQHVLYGAALALTAAVLTWARQADTPLPELIRDVAR